MRRILILSFVLLAALGVRSARAQDYKVIVNEANPVSTMTAPEVAQIFLKKKTTWPSGTPAVPVDQTSGRARAAFSQEVLGRDIAAMRLYWQQQVFSGRATAPDEKPSDAAVMAVVRDNP
jgi:ABC-type phosphate transport system substrate-binding protein